MKVNVSAMYNWLIFGYLLLVTILTSISKITYGYGLGDLFYFFVCSLFVISQLAVTIFIYRKQKIQNKRSAFYFCGTFFLLMAVYLTYKFTLGRGSEYIWNGDIFY